MKHDVTFVITTTSWGLGGRTPTPPEVATVYILAYRKASTYRKTQEKDHLLR
jgi:hypothetical protein